MKPTPNYTLVTALVVVAYLAALPISRVAAQTEPPAKPATPPVLHLTLDEVKQRVLADNKLLQLAALNVKSKGYAVRAAQALYFPQIFGQSIYLHFNDDLGTVLTTRGRHIVGPRGNTILNVPSVAVNLPVINQETAVNTIATLQPITDLLKVRQGVRIAQADEGIAQAQLEKGTRELISGVEQLYWGLLIAQKIRAGAEDAIARTEPLAQAGNLEAREAVVEGKQAVQQVTSQIGDLQEQLAILLDVPTCTQFDLAEPPVPVAPIHCADEAVNLALASSPEIREAEQTVKKAEAAVKAAKLDYVPSIAVLGGYTNQTFADYIQPNVSYIGVIGSYTFVDWGKRRNTVRERDQLVAMANLKVLQTQDDVRQKALKAFRDYVESQQAVQLAGQLVEARKEIQKAAKTPAAMFKAAQDSLEAGVGYLKADLAQRTAYVKLMSLIGGH
jgi:outer membrane protein TolC